MSLTELTRLWHVYCWLKRILVFHLSNIPLIFSYFISLECQKWVKYAQYNLPESKVLPSKSLFTICNRIKQRKSAHPQIWEAGNCKYFLWLQINHYFVSWSADLISNLEGLYVTIYKNVHILIFFFFFCQMGLIVRWRKKWDLPHLSRLLIPSLWTIRWSSLLLLDSRFLWERLGLEILRQVQRMRRCARSHVPRLTASLRSSNREQQQH